MAGTIVLGSFDNENVQFEIDYDDNMDVLTFRCRNNASESAFGLLERITESGDADGVQYGFEAPAGEITTIAVPQGNQGLRLRPAAKAGHFDGYSADLRYPF